MNPRPRAYLMGCVHYTFMSGPSKNTNIYRTKRSLSTLLSLLTLPLPESGRGQQYQQFNPLLYRGKRKAKCLQVNYHIYYPSEQPPEERNRGGSCPHPHVLIGRNPSSLAAVNRRYPLPPPQMLFIRLKSLYT